MAAPAGVDVTLATWHDEARPEIVSDELQWHPAGLTQALIIDLEAFFTSVCDQAEAE